MKTPSCEVWSITVAWFSEHMTLDIEDVTINVIFYLSPHCSDTNSNAVEHKMAMISLTTELVLLTCADVSNYEFCLEISFFHF